MEELTHGSSEITNKNVCFTQITVTQAFLPVILSAQTTSDDYSTASANSLKCAIKAEDSRTIPSRHMRLAG